MEAVEKEQHVCKLMGILLMYLNEMIPTSGFAGLDFRG